MDENEWKKAWEIDGPKATHKATKCVVQVKAREVPAQGITGEVPLGGAEILYSLDIDDIPRNRMDLANQAVELWKAGDLGPD